MSGSAQRDKMKPTTYKHPRLCFGLGAQGTEAVNGLVTSIDVPANKDNGKYAINFQRYTAGSRSGTKDTMEVDYIIGSDGANSRVAKVGAVRGLARVCRS